MEKIYIRDVSQTDTTRVTEIYNSNPDFLSHHIGKTQVDTAFIQNEFTAMKSMGFLSCVIAEQQTDKIIGILDFKQGECTYLSLFMLDSALHAKGLGTLCYQLFEKHVMTSGTQAIRIDVVNDYPGNVVPFWRKQGFSVDSPTKLTWGEKCSDALVMMKNLLCPTFL